MNTALCRLDSDAIRRHFGRAAPFYDGASVLAREVASRMSARLDYMKRVPGRVLDLGCGTGADESVLRQRYAKAAYLGVDLSLPMLSQNHRPGLGRGGWRWWSRQKSSRVCARADSLPFAAGSVGMVWSNFMLHHVSEPLAVFREVFRVLEVEGLIMFSCLGPDTLKELRALAPERVHAFFDMHDLGDALVAAGFAEPVMDREDLVLTYADFDQLVKDLRANGGRCAREDRPKGAMSQAAARALRQGYERYRADNRLPASFEIVFGHAWKPAPRESADGRAILRFDRGVGRRKDVEG